MLANVFELNLSICMNIDIIFSNLTYMQLCRIIKFRDHLELIRNWYALCSHGTYIRSCVNVP